MRSFAILATLRSLSCPAAMRSSRCDALALVDRPKHRFTGLGSVGLRGGIAYWMASAQTCLLTNERSQRHEGGRSTFKCGRPMSSIPRVRVSPP